MPHWHAISNLPHWHAISNLIQLLWKILANSERSFEKNAMPPENPACSRYRNSPRAWALSFEDTSWLVPRWKAEVSQHRRDHSYFVCELCWELHLQKLLCLHLLILVC
jgi:hypothetical protein